MRVRARRYVLRLRTCHRSVERSRIPWWRAGKPVRHDSTLTAVNPTSVYAL